MPERFDLSASADTPEDEKDDCASRPLTAI